MTRTDDLSELKRLAEAAQNVWGGGEWFSAETLERLLVAPKDAAYIAATPPFVILSLIARLETAEARAKEIEWELSQRDRAVKYVYPLGGKL